MKTEHQIFISKKNEEEEEENQTGIYICENTDGILDPLEQMLYALNETQVRYGSVVVLKNAP
ncbi:MAG: hypothetical protein WAK17_24595 [Candidatus Nitrosopolaris sp.]|jgi:hypothetical protein